MFKFENNRKILDLKKTHSLIKIKTIQYFTQSKQTKMYLHRTSNRASTGIALAGYDSWNAKHFNVDPCFSLVAGT